MAVSLVSALPTIHPVYDPLIVALQDAGDPASARTGQSQVEVQLEIEDVLNSDSWRLIGEYLNPYNYDTDEAQVNLNQALIGALDHFIPDLTSSGKQAITGTIKRYRLKARDVVDGEAQGSFATLGPALAWLAGNPYPQIGTDLLDGKAYLLLSSRSLARRLHPNETISLQVLPVVSGTPTLRIKANFTDGTDQTDTTALSAATALVPFYVNITLPSYVKAVRSLEIDFTGLTGTAEKLIYWMIQKPSPYFRQLFYCNSLGGLDHLALTGKCEEINQPISELFEAQEYPPTNAQRGNTRAFNQRAVDSLVLRTGYMSEDELRSLRDLTLRNEVYIQEGNALRKLILNNSQWRVKTDGDFLHALEVTARYAWEERAYGR
jgi:hypothetical protein